MTTITELKRHYQKGKRRKVFAILSLLVALFAVVIISISFGAGSPRFNEVMQILLAKIFPSLYSDAGSRLAQTIVLELRLPRVILAVLAGAGLAASGATMQGVLRNPLVSSYSLGISSAAGFGAALAIVFGVGVIAVYGQYLIIINAFIFSTLAMLLVYGIARLRGITSETVILVGVTIGFFFSAMVALIQYLAPEHEAVRAVVFWLMGGLNLATWEGILLVFPIVAVTMLLMLFQAWNINVMCMGEDVATSLGVTPKHVLVVTMVLSTLATAAIIAFTGIIGFVGLVSPHIARISLGNDHRFLIPSSALAGACLLLCSDTIGRLIIQPAELPVGIITSLLGVPFFIYILLSRRRQNWG